MLGHDEGGQTVSKGFLVGATIGFVLFLLVSHAWASIPDPMNSCWGWTYRIGGEARATVCPDGDGSFIVASVRDQYDAPMPGVIVTASFDANCDMTLCSPVEGITEEMGLAGLFVCAGYDVHNVLADTACCVVTTRVRCLGVTIPHCTSCPFPPAGCTETDIREWRFLDMSQATGSACTVEGLDYGIFSYDWQTSHCRSDFNDDGYVEGLDYSIFSQHWLHSYSSP